MEFANPNTDSRYDLTALKDQLKNTAGFAVFFAEQVRLAHGGDPNAITCVESYVYPSDNELTALNIHKSHWGPVRKCTDLGLLVHVISNDQASIFP